MPARHIIIALLAIVGCSGESLPQQLVMEQVTIMREFGEVLGDVDDKLSAEEHKAAVALMVKRMNALRTELQMLPEQEKQACLELSEAHSSDLQAARAKIKSELTRIRLNAEIQSVLGRWLDKL